MPNPASFLAIAALMFATGLGIPVMATLNSQLGQQLASPAAATFILFAVGLVLSAAVLAMAGTPQWSGLSVERPWLFAGAAFILFYTLSITWAGPRIGIGNAVFFVLFGQLIAAAVIDHFGLLGALRFEMTARRAMGLAVMALGVYLAKRRA